MASGYANQCDQCGAVVWLGNTPGFQDTAAGWIRVTLENGDYPTFCTRGCAIAYLSK